MKRSSVGFAIALMGLLAACGGSDDKNTGKTASPNKGEAGNKAEAGIACGAKTCKLPKELEGQEACCVDMFAGTCGVKMGANCRAIPKTDDRCPAPELNVRIPGMGNAAMGIFGCCTAADECGIDFGAGCEPRTFACMFIGPDQVEKIKPQTCGGEELPLPANCGTNMIRIPGGAAGSGM
jgi:hypothetical protein